LPLSIVVISSLIGKTPEDITYSFVFDEAQRLAANGVEVHVVRSKLEGDSYSCGIRFHGIRRSPDPKAFRLTLSNIPQYSPTSLLRHPASIYWENLYALNVSKVIEKNSIDLIHAHFAYPEGLVGLLAKRRTGKPLIVTCHGYDLLIEPSAKYGVRLSKRIDSIVRRVLNEAEAVVTASEATFNEARKIVKNSDRIHLIPNAVDIQRFNPTLNSSKIRKRLGIGNRIVVFTLRAHEPKYGLEYLIRAVPKVVKEREDVLFVIGGDGSLRRYHKQLAVKLGVNEKIMFTGKIPQDESSYYYAMSDIVVVPSIQEAFGLTVTEAMACGKPVIGTNIGGIPDQIIDSYNGFLVHPRNPKDMAEKILRLIGNPNEARRMGINGRKMVEENFDLNKRIDKIIQLYMSLMK
jgi:glycosyltransferase involved in cell wall biosynthesis